MVRGLVLFTRRLSDYGRRNHEKQTKEHDLNEAGERMDVDPGRALDGVGLGEPRRWQVASAQAIASVYIAFVLFVFPWMTRPLLPVPPIVALLTSGLIACELATTALLTGLFLAYPIRPILLLACAYFYSALMAIFHVLTFPGALLPEASVIGGGQITGFGFNAWRVGFVGLLLASAATSWRRRLPATGIAPRVLVALISVALAVGAVVAVGVVIHPSMPTFVQGTRFSTLDQIPGWTALGLGLLSLALLFRADVPNTSVRLWLALALVTYCGDLFLSTSSGGRYTMGWYAGRISGAVSGSILFLFFLGEALIQQRRAVMTERALRARTLGLQVEMSRRAETEAQLYQSRKLEAVGQLSGGIAHDFNNLLAVVVGNLDMLKRAPELAEKSRKWVERALLAADRGAKLTSQLLVFSRAQKLELRPVDVKEVVEGMRELLKRTLGPQIRIEVAIAASPSWVLSEPTQLELTLMNLALNARDAMPDGGAISLLTEVAEFSEQPDLRAGKYLVITVADTGTGMPPEVAARAFDPFYTTKPVGKGTGLGLTQAIGLAQRAAGTARIESAPGEGTAVRLILPIAERPHVRQTAPIPPRVAERDRRVTALVVDDDADVLETLSALLDRLGVAVKQASGGASALAMLDEFEPDLLLVDFAMPDIDGAEVAKAAQSKYPGVPIVFVTGYSDSEAIERAAGRDALVLRKPFRETELHAAIARALAPRDGGSADLE